jgi:hypothetical protein
MNKQLMKKAAEAIRKLGSENEGLKRQVEDLQKTASSLGELEKKASAAEILVKLVADGELDPEDALEKFAEVLTLTPEQIKLVLGKSRGEQIGHVKVASADSDIDPLSAYLLA